MTKPFDIYADEPNGGMLGSAKKVHFRDSSPLSFGD